MNHNPSATRAAASPAISWLAAAILVLCACAPAHAQSVGTTQDLLTRLYGLSAAPLLKQSDVTVGTTAANLTLDNAARFEAIYIDTGASNCTLSHSNQVTTASGVQLNASGGVYIEDFRSDFLLPTYQMWGVCAAAGGTIHIIELILG